VKHVIVRKKCSNCNEGEMAFDGSAYSNTWGTYYKHKCTKCDKKEDLPEAFPHDYIKWEDNEKQEEWK